MRCAIYTRKSSEEGLAQEFNSLDAQRESAEAYILSQRQAGWTALAERYDDGGYTGANLERPALQRLLSDVGAGRIDCVVVYKVDRLSRSLLDFARLMGVFEKRTVNLVSVTQQFNTTASLGRLTLNILLSFAQFEREIIAERTRDKMSAARRKGEWVGGTPVLGYDVAPGGGKLVVNEDEAHQVRAVFALYLEHKALSPVLREIQQRQWTTKRWTTNDGRLHPGRPFEQQDLVGLLGNVMYAGKVRYQGQTYAGEHAAIVEEGVWARVQGMLQKSGRSVPRKVRAPVTPSPSDRTRTGRPQPDDGREMEQASTQTEGAAIGVPRITRLLALALKFEGLLQQGVVKDYAELARLGQVSRPRVTQIMNLLSLAPDIQQQILSWAQEGPSRQSVRETSVRALSSEVIWSQREQWKRWSTVSDHQQNETATASSRQ
jgi:DNA invertase Pin-like site-specific DNA recombinase